MKDDNIKAPIRLIPPDIILDLAKTLAFGAQKYGEWNWRDDGSNTEHMRTYDSIQRHLLSYANGEDIDKESGLHHLSHAATQIIILMTHVKEHPEMDDRYKGDKNENRGNSKRTKTKIHTEDIYYSQQ